MRKSGFAAILAVVVPGCAFHGSVKPADYAMGDPAPEKIAAAVAYQPESFDASVRGMLAASFRSVVEQPDSVTNYVSRVSFQSRVLSLTGSGNAQIEAVLVLDLVDPASRRTAGHFVARDVIAYSPPGSATALHLNCVVVVRSSKGLGSGFFVSKDGLVVTNAHVVDRDTRVSVRSRSGATVFAEVVALDPARDLALLRTGTSNAPWLTLAALHESSIGADVIAVGSPEGLDWSISKGIISAIRDLDGVVVVQTDAAVNHGNSGGPLVSTDSGRVIGVASFGFRKDLAEGLNFAISAREIKTVFSAHLPN